ncbi:putative two-component system sensor kinase [Nocardia nova SH22a]|uniref:Putative two-component system sensor kinase n=1 Tax=Nocardia nova SH22a TaxID=1415166 RepID=W5TJX3_9NOCA|nr:histidine kinase [Nocardia nova]AHH19660.1 putative two-component system sensor kinase [Nocardia nova SH22a]
MGLWLLVVVCAAGSVAVLAYSLRRREDGLGTAADRSTFDTLHTVSLAAPGLREGLTETGALRAVKHLRALLGSAALAITDLSSVLAVDGQTRGHTGDAMHHARRALSTGRTQVLGAHEVVCAEHDCPIRAAVASPIHDGEVIVGAVVAYGPGAPAILVRAVEEVTAWVSGQVALAGADAQRGRAAEAELRALRAQISPHFIYNSLTAIASFTRTDPERARELLLEFADFTRYALRSGAVFTTVAEELRNTERYLMLEQARFGDRLRLSLRVAPEVLPTAIPFLVVQPLVENAVRHGLGGEQAVVTVSISAADAGPDAVIVIEDDGAGADPRTIGDALRAPDREGPRKEGIGLGNVDARVRQIYGDAYGLVLETAPGAGTKVTVRIPKSAAAVRSQG